MVLVSSGMPAGVAGTDQPESVAPGWTAFIVVLVLVVAVIVLLRSFVKQTKKVDFDEDPGRGADETEDDGGTER